MKLMPCKIMVVLQAPLKHPQTMEKSADPLASVTPLESKQGGDGIDVAREHLFRRPQQLSTLKMRIA